MRALAPLCLLCFWSCSPPTPPPPPLGAAKVNSLFYLPGNGTMTAVIQFSDDVRDDCTAADQHVSYGHQALLSMFSVTDFVKGETMPWVTNADHNAASPPVAFFSFDALSGIDLSTVAGTATVMHAPENGNPDYTVLLVSPDAGIDASYTVPPMCP